MNKSPEENIKNVIIGIHGAFAQELLDETEEDWFFGYDDKVAIANNIYNIDDKKEEDSP